MEFSVDSLSGGAVVAIVAAAAFFYVPYRIRQGPVSFERLEKQGSLLLGRPVLNFGYWALAIIGRQLAAIGVSPNLITWCGLLWAVAAGWAAAKGFFGMAALAAFLSGCCDALDGMVADLTNRKTAGGVVLDSALDRYADFALLFGAALYYRTVPVMLAAVLLAVHGSYMVSYATAKAEAIGKEPPRGTMKRPERWVWLTAGLLVSGLIRSWFSSSRAGWPFAVAIVIVAVLSNVSAARRLWFVWISAGGGRPA